MTLNENWATIHEDVDDDGLVTTQCFKPYNTHNTCAGDYSHGQNGRSSSIINEINYQD